MNILRRTLLVASFLLYGCASATAVPVVPVAPLPPAPPAPPAAPSAPAAPAPTAPAPTWVFMGNTSYEERAPGLGRSQKFEGPAGYIDVYVYDLQKGAWKPGVSDPDFAAHFLSTIEEVKLFAQRGVYLDLEIGPIHDLPVAGQDFRTVDFKFVRDGQPMVSYTFLTGIRDKLLKYRMSFFAPTPFDAQQVARKFIEDNMRGLKDAD